MSALDGRGDVVASGRREHPQSEQQAIPEVGNAEDVLRLSITLELLGFTAGASISPGRRR
jgi:hypothetical protein